MAKKDTQYICQDCGHTQIKWSGKCPSCGSWNKMQEEQIQQVINQPVKNRHAMIKTSGEIFDLSEVQGQDFPRVKSTIKELDNVLGGGFVKGSVILLAGDPGIGKSTLLIQTAEKMNNNNEKTLYLSGEESISQIALRAKRLGLMTKGISIFSETEIEKILNQFEKIKPDFVIIDSIQTLYTSALTSAPGSVSQIKDCAARLTRFAKENNTTMVIIGHVTKDGELAGPRVLEHIVDTVLAFEGEKDNYIRLLRSSKNRFGPTDEIGVFSMREKGLEEIRDLASTFIVNQVATMGSISFITQEGNRPIIVETQALLDSTNAPMPIKSAVGFDQKRLSMIMAILNKYLGLTSYNFNVFVSIVGGFKTQDTSVDLSVALSMISSLLGLIPPEKSACFGEIGLTGELRTSFNFENKIREASRLGIKTIFMPFIEQNKQISIEKKYNIKLICCKNIAQATKEFKNYSSK